MTSSQVIAAARARPASPSRGRPAGRRAVPPLPRRSLGIRRDDGAVTPSSTNSSVPPESAAVTTGLRGQERFERHQAVVFVERHVDHGERLAVEAGRPRRRPRRGTSRVRDAASSAARSTAARWLPSPTTTSRTARARTPPLHGEVHRLFCLEARHRQHVVAVRAGESRRPSIGGWYSGLDRGRCSGAGEPLTVREIV